MFNIKFGNKAEERGHMARSSSSLPGTKHSQMVFIFLQI